MNPENETDPVYQRFIANSDPEAVAQMVNWYDNPWFPDVLRREMDHCRAVDMEKYNHVWLGQTRRCSEAQIFRGKYVVEPFESEGVEAFYYGADWGFAKDPTTLVRCFIRDGDLFVDYEAYGYGIELSNTAALFRSVPDSDRYRIDADCSRPETIAFLREPQNGHFDIHGAKKWSGSVEDGIEFLRSFRRIVIHPRCKNTIYEFGAYSFKVDKLTGNVLPIVAPGNDQCVDSIRYALVRLITRRTSIYDSGVL
jgi:phage terminase large subunit